MEIKPEILNKYEESVKMYVDALHEIASKIYDQGYNDARQETLELDRRARSIGRDEAWKCAMKLVLPSDRGGMNSEVFEAIFGNITYNEVFYNYSADEAIDMIKEYEDNHNKRKCCITCGYCKPDKTCFYSKHGGICNNYSAWNPKESIKVGDEVVCDYRGDYKFIVTWADGAYVNAISIDDKSMIEDSINRFTKTGKSYLDLVELLNKIKKGDINNE